MCPVLAHVPCLERRRVRELVPSLTSLADVFVPLRSPIGRVPRVCGSADVPTEPEMQAAKTLDCGHSVWMTRVARCCWLVRSE